MTNEEIYTAQDKYINLREEKGMPTDNAFAAGAMWARKIMAEEILKDIEEFPYNEELKNYITKNYGIK